VVARTTFYDSPVANSGPLPPRVGRATTYTITFTLSSGPNDLQDVEVAAVLPGGVAWREPVAVDVGTLDFNPATRELRWQILRLAAATGILRPPVRAAFQVALTAAANQVGISPVVVKSISASGQDTFTNTVQTKTVDDLTIELRTDPKSVFREWQVAP